MGNKWLQIPKHQPEKRFIGDPIFHVSDPTWDGFRGIQPMPSVWKAAQKQQNLWWIIQPSILNLKWERRYTIIHNDMYIYICICMINICTYVYIYIHMYLYIDYQISRAPGILGFLGDIGYQGHDAIFGAVYAHKGCTKKLEHHGLHGFALDQPSINGIGPIHRLKKWKRSETVGNGRKRSETVGNMIRPKLVQPAISQKKHFCATHFFLKVQRCPRGNGWKQSEIAPSLGQKTGFYNIKNKKSWTNATKQLLFCRAKVRSPTVSNRFPLDTFGPSKKKCVAQKCFFWEIAGWTSFGLIMFPTVSDRFRPFPTVSDRFHFSERWIWPIPFMEGWSSANPCKPWCSSFFVQPLCAYTAPNVASWPWYPIFPKNPKIPGAREIW